MTITIVDRKADCPKDVLPVFPCKKFEIEQFEIGNMLILFSILPSIKMIIKNEYYIHKQLCEH